MEEKNCASKYQNFNFWLYLKVFLETWNQYCERQRKFRQEFGNDQAAINKAIVSNILLSGPATIPTTTTQIGLTTFAGGRQLVNLSGGGSDKQQQKVQKIIVDLSKPPPILSNGADDNMVCLEINLYSFWEELSYLLMGLSWIWGIIQTSLYPSRLSKTNHKVGVLFINRMRG